MFFDPKKLPTVQKPSPGIELLTQVPAKQALEVHAPTFDTPLTTPTLTDTTVTNKVNAPVYAVALHGFLPPGMFALVAPASELSVLTAFVAQESLYNPTWDGGSNLTFKRSGVKLPRGVVVLHPGDVFHFGKVQDGVCVWVYNPWSGGIDATPGRYPQAGTPDVGMSDGTAPGPIPDPVLRCYGSPVAPHRIKYHPIAHAFWMGAPRSTAPSNYFDVPYVSLGASVTHLQIIISDVSTPSNAGPAGPLDLMVYWLSLAGRWVRHDDDDWTATGRGPYSTTHMVETYEVPRNVVSVVLREATGAGTIGWTAVLTDAEAPR